MTGKRRKRRRVVLRISTPEGYSVDVGVDDIVEAFFGKKYRQKARKSVSRGEDGIPVVDLREETSGKYAPTFVKDEDALDDDEIDELANLGKKKKKVE